MTDSDLSVKALQMAINLCAAWGRGRVTPEAIGFAVAAAVASGEVDEAHSAGLIQSVIVDVHFDRANEEFERELQRRKDAAARANNQKEGG